MIREDFLLQANEAEYLARDLLEFAGNLRARFSATEHTAARGSADCFGLRYTVARLMEVRKQRGKHLDAALLGAPVWDMLLTLFHASLSNQSLSVEEVCNSAGQHPATSKRWIAVLENFGLVEFGDQDKIIHLTDKGVAQMRQAIGEARDILFPAR
jgi:hypothetical protein